MKPLVSLDSLLEASEIAGLDFSRLWDRWALFLKLVGQLDSIFEEASGEVNL